MPNGEHAPDVRRIGAVQQSGEIEHNLSGQLLHYCALGNWGLIARATLSSWLRFTSSALFASTKLSIWNMCDAVVDACNSYMPWK